jgi:predicted phage terminase large subunit-like protein
MGQTTILTLAEADAMLEAKQRGQSLGEQAQEWSNSLRLFVRHAWADGIGVPDRFVPGWHIDAICEHLQAVTDGEINRLCICVPPGSSKSTVTSVCWPVWEWTRQPQRRFLTASYDRELATKFSQMSRDLILSEWFQSRWAHKFRLKVDENLKTAYANSRGGYRRSVPVGKGTGHHADVIVIDDPHDATSVLSEAKRNEDLQWHDGTITTRFTHNEIGAEVIIAQRLHEKDLLGHVLAQVPEAWTVLCLPERYESRHPQVTPARVRLPSGKMIAGDPREEEGELLCPARVNAAQNRRRALRMGAFAAAGQLQQRPAAREGAILKRTFWQFYPPAWREDEQRHHLPKFHGLVQSWDTAFKDKSVNDYVAGGLWGLTGPKMYLLALRHERMSLSQTKQAIKDMSAWATLEWPRLPLHILIENKTNGPEIIAELRSDIRGIVPFNSTATKVERAEAAEPALEGGAVYLPGVMNEKLPSFYDPETTPDMTQKVVEETSLFPYGEFDDLVDMVTMAVIWSRGAGRRSRATFGRARGIVPEQGSLSGQTR